MALNLEKLVFEVDTSQLEAATKEIEALGKSLSKVNKPVADAAIKSEKLAQAQAKTAESTAKAEAAQLKLEQAQKKSTEATVKSNSVLERQNLILEFMAQGNSKGQASILATAKAAGALDADMLSLNQTLKTQRTLIGGDPFDKSIGLMQKLQNEYKTTLEVTTLFNRNLGLTEKQMVDLAREKERLIALYGIEGRDIKGLATEYDKLIRQSVEINRTNASRTGLMRDQIKAQNDAAKSNEYIAAEMERVNRLTESNGDITSATNSKLIKFENALKLSGMTASAQADALNKYKTALLDVQKHSGNRQVDYLSRALGPQITDIFVGLTTGQSPLMVLLQQGGQLRDQFALAGVAGKDMGDMLTKATTGMVSSVKDVAIAVGTALGGAIVATGAAFTDFAGKITGVNLIVDKGKRYISSFGEESFGLIGTLNKVGAAFSMIAGVAVAGAISAFIAYSIALKQVISEESALSRSLELTGASMGLTKDSALALSQELAGSKGNVGSYVTTLTDMAKAGGITSENLKTVASTIVNVSKILGVSSQDLSKNFSKIAEKPLEALIPLAKELGTINVATLKHIQQLEAAGKYAEAAKVATEAYAGALRNAASVVEKDAGYIESFFAGLVKVTSDVWNNILNWGRAIPLATKLIEAQKELADLQSGSGFMTDQYRKNSIEVAKATIAGIQKQIDAEKELGNTKAKNASDVKKFEEDIKKSKKDSTDAAKEQRRLERDAEKYLNRISSLTNSATKEQENYTKAQKMALDIFADPDFKNYPQYLKIAIAGAIERAHAEELVADELELQKKISEAVIKTRNELVEAGAKQLDAAKLTTKSLQEDSDLYDYKLSLIGLEEKQVEKLLALRKTELEYEKEKTRIKSLGLMKGAESDLLSEAYQQFLIKRENLDKETNLKAAQDFQKQFENIKTSVTDSIVTALFEGGKAGGKKLRDLVTAELKKPITVLVKAVVDVAGAATNKLVSSGLNYLGSIALGGSTVGASLSAFGQGVAANFGTGAAVTSAGSATSAAFNAGASASQMAMAAGPYVLAAVAALNALGVFKSTKTVGGGLTGTLGTGNVQSYDLTRTSGTLFSGPSYNVASQGVTEQSSALESAFTAIRTSTAQMAESLGLSTDKVKTFTMAVGDVKVHPDIDQLGLVLDGLSDEDKVKKIEELLTKSSNAMAELVLGAGATAEQLVQIYNSAMDERYGLETRLLELQGNTVELRNRERAQLHESNRALYDQIKALEDLKEGVSDVTEALTEAAKAAAKAAAEVYLQNTISTTDDTYSALQRSIEAQKASLAAEISAKQTAIETRRTLRDSIQSSINDLKSLFDTLNSNIKELFSQVDSTSAIGFSAARSFISRSASAALTTGALPDADKLAESISTVRNTLDKTYYKTKADSNRDRILLANELVTLQKVTDNQLTTEEKTLKAVEDQIALLEQQIVDLQNQQLTLDGILETAKLQIDVIRGVDTSIVSLATAMQALANAIGNETTARSNVTAQAAAEAPTAIKAVVGGTEAQKSNLYTSLRQSGLSDTEIRAIVTETVGTQTDTDWNYLKKISGYASGGAYPGGLALVGEQGPELINFNEGGHVYTANQTAGLLSGNSELITELQTLRQEVVMLRAEVRADVQHNAKTAKLLDRVIPDGRSVQVTTAV